jgi:predicted O-methyltransferase YrrM
LLNDNLMKDLVFRFSSAFSFYRNSVNAHGLHSPFAYDFYCNVLKAKGGFSEDVFTKIENKRAGFLKDDTPVSGLEFGPSGKGLMVRDKLSKIAGSALKKPSRARLLARIAQRANPEYMIEIGTCLGITTSYLAASNRKARVFTLEGNEGRASVSMRLFQELKLDNIELHLGEFSHTLPEVLAKTPRLDFVFIDGNHRKDATVNYFKLIEPLLHNNSVVVLDDIRWSKEMYEAWTELRKRSAVRVSIELIDIGILYFGRELYPQHFKMRG